VRDCAAVRKLCATIPGLNLCGICAGVHVLPASGAKRRSGQLCALGAACGWFGRGANNREPGAASATPESARLQRATVTARPLPRTGWRNQAQESSGERSGRASQMGLSFSLRLPVPAKSTGEGIRVYGWVVLPRIAPERGNAALITRGGHTKTTAYFPCGELCDFCVAWNRLGSASGGIPIN